MADTKKRILLIGNNFRTGGIQSSMINAANELSKIYDVSVFCFCANGEMKDRLKENITVIESSWRLQAIVSTLPENKKFGFKFFFYKIFARVWSKLFNNRLPVCLAVKHQKPLGCFDIACSFTHEFEKHLEYTGFIRVLIEKVNAPVKFSWIHRDYRYVKDDGFNLKYYNKIDAVVGVSDSVSAAFADNVKGLKVPVVTCYNMLDYEKIYSLSDLPQKIPYKSASVVCFSACRLSKEKALERMLNACADIFIKNNVVWYIAGEGPERANIEACIKNNNLQNNVFLLGDTPNPFNYMKNADLYLSVSYEEAAPLVYFEAKALHLPIFATKILSAEEMLDNTVDFIAENTAEDIKIQFGKVTENPAAIKERKELLQSYKGTNEAAVNFFRKYLGDAQ